MRFKIVPSYFYLFLVGILSINLACGSQNPIVEKQKGEIDYLTRENEELHRLLAQMEQENRNLDSERPVAEESAGTTRTNPPIDNTSSRVVQAETISDENTDEKRIEATDDIAQAEVAIQEDVTVKEPEPEPIIKDNPEPQIEVVTPPAMVREVVDEVVSADPVTETVAEEVSEELAENDIEEIQEVTTEDEGDIIVETSQAPSYVDQPDLYVEDDVNEEGISEEEAERLAWESRPRQRPQAPLASLSTRQFFEDGTADLTRSAKIYLKLVATILGREHKDEVIEIESQDVDDEPELLSERVNTVLQELERKMPGILERVILLETPLTYSNSKKVEDPHHIKFYPVKLQDQ